MRAKFLLCWALLLTAPWCDAAVDFAISLNLSSPFTRFGVDAQGNVLIAANPPSCTLPTVKPLYACGPIWIGKLDPSGHTLLFATYLGNSPITATALFTQVAGIAADPSGNLIVAAHTVAPDLPTAKPIQAAPKSSLTCLYLAKLSADGSRLLYSTYLGGSAAQSALSLAVDATGAVYVAATTSSSDFPTTPASVHEAALNTTVIAKLAADGALQYAATFPFEFYTDVKPIQLDVAGRALLVSNAHVLEVAAEGGSLTRTPLPGWTAPSTGCAIDATKNPVCPAAPWALPRAAGGFAFAGTAATGVPVTADGLQTTDGSGGYVRIENGHATHPQLPSPVSGLAVDPQDGNRIYAATGGGLLDATDNGRNWSVLHDGPCLAIAIDPFDSKRLYLSVDAIANPRAVPQVYRSTDRGATWTALHTGAPELYPMLSIAADPHVQGLLYGAGTLLYRSLDGGDTWDARSVGPSRQDMSPSASTSTRSMAVQVDPTHPGWAYVGGITKCLGFCPVTQNLSQSQDRGNTWTTPTPGLDPLTFASTAPLIAVDPNTGDVMEGVGNRLLVYRKGDFSASQVLYPAATTAVAFDPAQRGVIYLAVQTPQGYFIVKSVDEGGTWTGVTQLDRPAYNLVVGADGVLQASQAPDVPKGYFVAQDSLNNVGYGTYLGGAFTQVNAAAAFGGKTYVAGKTRGGLPVIDAGQPVLGGGADGFVAAFDDNGALLWSTYVGGSADDSIDWVLPLPDGSVVVVGTTASTDFPSLTPSSLGAGDTFIARVRPADPAIRSRDFPPGHRTGKIPR